ncbi:M20 family peptidase [Curvibacter sp. APW13]|uniref:M20 family peptidase n=1 Tax=Curvibacter sp. APW13 TaxID=3077236 RepID=UPI0028DF4B6C|nr:M20 family peptidase [Curvibacter sp. APW13]MDT8990370.1 M20 family peptidase [Curvibacter sp. APW13]
MIKKALLGLLALVLLLAAAVGINTARKGSRQLQVDPLAPVAVDEKAVAERLAEAVRFKTVSSREDAALNADQFKAFHAMLQTRFPKVHATLQREVVGGLSLLYTWQGADPKAKPIALLAHQDVVPVAPGTEGDWKHAPFSGAVQEGFVWGRGAWDDKGNLMSQLEAVEMLLASGYQPPRTIYLAFGADEEVGGPKGAAQIAALLKQRGVALDFVIDEGLLVLDGVVPGVKQPTALVGLAEKGYMSVVLKVSATPGHSSVPPLKGTSAIAMLSASLKRLDDEQLPAALQGVAYEMFDTLAPEMSGFSRVAMSNLWLFGPVVQKKLESAASTNAMLRTTTALTIVNAGNKDNVLPGRAEATVNFRLLPGDTQENVLAHMRSKVAAPEGQFELYALDHGKPASSYKVAPTSSVQYATLNRTIREVFPDAVVAPGLMVAGTDSIHFGEISDHIFKFSPIRANADDLKRFHGTNERLSVKNYAEAIRFYHRLIPQMAGAK